MQIAEECGFICSPSGINHTFSLRGYGRHPPTYRPAMNKEQKRKRKIFSDKALGILEGQYHLVIYTDETIVRVGERRGQYWLTRNEEERCHKDCIERRHKGFTEFLFCGAYTQMRRGRPIYGLRRPRRRNRPLSPIYTSATINIGLNMNSIRRHGRQRMLVGQTVGS